MYREKLERDSPEYRKILELLNNVVRGSEPPLLSHFLIHSVVGVGFRRNLEKHLTVISVSSTCHFSSCSASLCLSEKIFVLFVVTSANQMEKLTLGS